MKDKGNLQGMCSPNTSPLKSIYGFLTANIKYDALEHVMNLHCERAVKRLMGLQSLQQVPL